MIRDTVRAMLKALPDVKEDGATLLIDTNWEVSLQAGRNGGSFAVQQVTRITVEAEYALVETHRGQRVVILLDEIRGALAEPSSADRMKGRKPGFV